MRIENEMKLDYDSVLIRPKRSTLQSRSEVTLLRSYKLKYGNDYHGIPIMSANMDGVGTFEMAETLSPMQLFTCLSKGLLKVHLRNWIDERGKYKKHHFAVSIGSSSDDYERFDAIYSGLEYKGNLKFVCIDVANGYTQSFVDFVKMFRDKHPELALIAGNVVTGEMTEELLLAGADIVKCGIGPGSVCSTRVQTGVGYPQLSAVIECADAAHGLSGHIIADGGCTTPGDVAKAFAGGADFVMLGGMLAGHKEGGGEIVQKHFRTNEVTVYEDPILRKKEAHDIYKTKQFVKFYGMSSKAANNKHFGGLKDYRASEGREVLIPYKGDVSTTVQEILGGLRSTCTYVGAKSLKELSKRATFVRCINTHNRIFEKNGE